jgi:carbon-monoxide dehydrogenase large subunit
MIVEGQIHGGTAQGIGAALFEELTFDDQGQPQSGSFLNYLVPSAVEVPNFTLGHMIHPSPVVPGGMKGVGEAGIIGPPAAVIAAIEDALYDHDVRFTSIPLTPAKIFDAIQVVQST